MQARTDNNLQKLLLQSAVTSGGAAQTYKTSSTESDPLSREDQFETYLEGALDAVNPSGQISEADLYAALIGERLLSVGRDAANAYETAQDYYAEQYRLKDGYVSSDRAAADALGYLVQQGRISGQAAAEINGQAWAAAQLDEDPLLLSSAVQGAANEESGGTVDGTVPAGEAMAQALETIMKIESGDLSAAPRSVAVPAIRIQNPAVSPDSSKSSGRSVHHSSGAGRHSSHPSGSSSRGSSGSDSSPADPADPTPPATSTPGVTPPVVSNPGASPHGFSWNPDNNGIASVTMPSSVSGSLARVEIHSDLPAAADTRLDVGQYAGRTESGQSVYNFSRPGSDYGHDSVVVGFKQNGTQVAYDLSDPAQPVSA